MPLGKLLSVFKGGDAASLDDASWLPAAQTHSVPENAGPAYDLAVQARLRREREAAGEDGALLCLGPAPWTPILTRLLSLAFLAAGGGAAGFGLVEMLQSGFGVIEVLCVIFGTPVAALAAHTFLGTFNPKLSLRADRDTFAPGEPATIRWAFSRPPRRAHNLTISLVAQERATYRQGTSDTTATEDFFAEERVELEECRGGPPLEGTFELGLPAEAMHSFESPNNAVAWRLDAHASVRFWPDIRRSVPLRVWAGPDPIPAIEERA